jgi:orotidine-5'-phosphate decarboxylase
MAETDTRPSFRNQLQTQWDQGKFVCLGLDVDLDKLPESYTHGINIRDPRDGFMARQNLFDGFLRPIIDATADTVAAFKPNIAFFEGDHGKMLAFENTMNYLHSHYPDIPIIGDTKRADIGNTNKFYAEMFDRWGFDAMTTNPYFGHDTYPSLVAGHEGRGLIVLCKTTNPGAELYQDAPVDLNLYRKMQIKNPLTMEEMRGLSNASFEFREEIGEALGHEIPLADWQYSLPLYRIIAARTATLADENPNIALVVGATHPEAFAPVRRLAPNVPFLIPGIGTQGGDLEKTLQFAPDSNHQGMIINSGSAILYASSGENFAEAARNAALKLDKQIREGLKIA